MPQLVAPGVTLHTRQEVGLPANTAPKLTRTQVGYFIVHYSTGQELGRDDYAQWVRDIEHHHRHVRKWDNGFAYCWAVARDPDPEQAHIIEGRGFSQGGHTFGHNTDGVGVVFLGDDDPEYDDATPGVRRALKWLADHADTWRGQRLIRTGHRDFNATSCPGLELHGWVHSGMPVAPYNGRHVVSLPLPTPPRPAGTAPSRSVVRPNPTLRRGAYGDQVTHLQRALNVFDQRLVDDGVFGRRTRHAVISFQSFWGLVPDGIYGHKSAAALDGALRLAGK